MPTCRGLEPFEMPWGVLPALAATPEGLRSPAGPVSLLQTFEHSMCVELGQALEITELDLNSSPGIYGLGRGRDSTDLHISASFV